MAIVWKRGLNWNSNALVWTNWVDTAMTYVDWKSNKAGSCNGSSSYISVNNYSLLNLTSSYTIITMLYMTSLPASWRLYALVDKNTWNRNWYEFELWNDWWTQTIFISHLSASTATTYLINYTLPINKWIDLWVSFSWSTINFWLNWGVIWTITWVTTIPTAWTSVLNIWRNPQTWNRFYSWKIDEVEIHNTDLTQAEIKNKYLYYNWFI
jgi:hypothetical protein